MQSPILITGCGRSGTSMIAGVIGLCGAYGGDMGGEDRNFENQRIHRNVLDEYMNGVGADTDGQYPLPNVETLPIPRDWAQRVMSELEIDGYKGGPWMVKGSRLCLTWPVWEYAFPNAKWILVRRRTADILNSCQKTDFMRAFRSESTQQAVGAENEHDGWLWWVHQHEQRMVEMLMEGLNCRVVWPERMVWGDYQQMYETIEWLGLKWTEKVLTFIDPKLWKARRATNGNAASERRGSQGNNRYQFG